MIDPNGMLSGDPNAPDNQYDQQYAWLDNVHAQQDAYDQAYAQVRAQNAWRQWGMVYFGIVPALDANTDNSEAGSTGSENAASPQQIVTMNGFMIVVEGSGIKGPVLNAQFTVSSAPGTYNTGSGLEIIQTIYRSTDGPVYGTQITIGGKIYYGNVDGGARSLVGEQYPGMPYYYSKQKLKEFSLPWHRSAGTITAHDNPNTYLDHKVVRFETIIVVTNFNNTGIDKVVGAFQWGFYNGAVPKSQPITLKSTPSKEALQK
jgi:hypothetical protein